MGSRAMLDTPREGDMLSMTIEELEAIEVDESEMNDVEVEEAVPLEVVSAKFGTIKRSVDNHWSRVLRLWASNEEFEEIKQLRRDTRLRAGSIFRQQPKAQTALLCDDSQFTIERSGTNESFFVELLPTRMLYRQLFHQIPHVNVFCTSGKDLSVVTVEKGGDPDIKKALILTVKRGYQTATVSLSSGVPHTPTRRRSISFSSPKKEPSLEYKIVRSVQDSWFPKCACYAVEDPEVALELLMLEREASDNTMNFRLGVTCANRGQKTEAEFFANREEDCSARFFDFMDLMGDRIDLFGHQGFRGQLSVTEPGKQSYFVRWREWEIMYHLSCFLNGEEQRRLMGNDTAMIYFHDSEEEEFPTSCPRSMMTQLFILVQPAGPRKYRVASFARNALARYPPTLPPQPVFDCSTDVGRELLRDFLLAKVMNGYRTATQCAPLKKLFQRPREVRLQSLAQRFPMADAQIFVPKKKK